jgi:hypothetical protein
MMSVLFNAAPNLPSVNLGPKKSQLLLLLLCQHRRPNDWGTRKKTILPVGFGGSPPFVYFFFMLSRRTVIIRRAVMLRYDVHLLI